MDRRLRGCGDGFTDLLGVSGTVIGSVKQRIWPRVQTGEAGQLKVRKCVRTDRESVEVATECEEVDVERVLVEGEAATEAEIGEEEIRVPVIEEEVVVEKRPVAKEEVRVRKDLVEDTEVVEEDVRREEINGDDESAQRGP